MSEQQYPSGARHMPIENDFTRVFNAIKELEARVERMDAYTKGLGESVDNLQQRVWSGGETVSKFDWQPWEPDYKALFESEQLNAGRLLKEISDETEKRRNAEAEIIDLKVELDIAMVFRRDLDEAITENNQLRFVLSILAAVKDDGWIEWHGGDCPVGRDVSVEIETRCGFEGPEPARDFFWSHYGTPSDIIAYRIAR